MSAGRPPSGGIYVSFGFEEGVSAGRTHSGGIYVSFGFEGGYDQKWAPTISLTLEMVMATVFVIFAEFCVWGAFRFSYTLCLVESLEIVMSARGADGKSIDRKKETQRERERGRETEREREGERER